MNVTSTANVVHGIANRYFARSMCGTMTHTMTKTRTNKPIDCSVCLEMIEAAHTLALGIVELSVGLPLVADDGAEILTGTVVSAPEWARYNNVVYVKWNSDHITYSKPMPYESNALRSIATVEVCRWFARCGVPAIGRRRHPILPPVPVCGAHSEWECELLGHTTV
jgi:hypothetical protein